MAFRRSYGRVRARFRSGGTKVKKALTSARRTASKHRGKAKMLTTVAMALGAYLAYDKLIKK